MAETEGDSGYLPNYGLNQGYGSTQRPKVSVRNVAQTHSQQVVDNFVDEGDDEVEVDEEQEHNGGDNEINGQDHDDDDNIDNDNDNNDNDDDDDDDNNTDNDNDNDNDNDDDENLESFNLHRHPKKRKLKSLSSSFELMPRVPPPPQPLSVVLPSQLPPPAATKPSFGGRNTLTDWSEPETFVLLEAWGKRFLQRGRKSLRSEEWQEVAEKVSQESKTERTDTQCRNRLDTLKKKYKKEKALLQTVKPAKTTKTRWVYFKKMDNLMSSTPQQSGLSCGVDSGEYVFMNPRVYVDRSNGLDEMRDSPGNTDSQEGDEDDDSDLLPSKKSKVKGGKVNGGSFRLLAESINKFSDIYEKIENSKQKQMIELEKMRMEFHKKLELQKKQILERARNEIAEIRRADREENDSTENISG